MTITVAPARNEYTANAAQTIFNYTFKIFTSTDLNVYITPAGQEANDSIDLTTAYTVTGLGDEDGGTITLSTGTDINDLVTIVSNVPSSRTTDYQNNGDFRPDVVNADFDRVVSIAKKIEDNSNRSLLLQQSQQDPKPLSLPNPASQFLMRWKSDLTGLENVNVSELSPGLFPSDAFMLQSTLANKIVDTAVLAGQVYMLSDRAGGIFDVIIGTGTANGFDIVAHNTLDLSFSLRVQAVLNCQEVGVVFDGVTGVFSGINAALNTSAAIVTMPVGHGVLDGDLIIPNHKSLIGAGSDRAAGEIGTTLLYPGVGEAIRQVGVQNVVPYTKGELSNFRIRKTTQSSTKGAIALISGSGVSVADIRIDSDTALQNFTYGVVCDQSEIITLRRLSIEGVLTAGVFLTNGDEYTPGSSTNFTNVVSIYDINVNGSELYGILHNGGATFKLSGGNINGCPIGVQMGGLNNFIVESILFEAGDGLADIILTQFKGDGVSSVGGCSGGRISECRTSSSTTNCIFVNAPGSQASHISIFDNRFGSARSGSAIGLSDSDAMQHCVIGTNVNLGGSGKDYLDSGIYTWNSVTAISDFDQQEQKRMVLMPGITSTANCGRERGLSFTQAVNFTVTDVDDVIHCNTTNNVVTVDLPIGTLGRTITILRKAGLVNVVTVDAGAGKTVSVNGTAAQTRSLSAQGNAITIQCDADAGNWFTISETTV